MGQRNVSQGHEDEPRAPRAEDATDLRFERLEIKASDLEIALGEMHAALLSQSRELATIRGRLEHAERRLAAIGRDDQDAPPPEAEVPPHY